jgi:hypothetical protein
MREPIKVFSGIKEGLGIKRKELSMQQAMGIFCGFRTKSP